MIVPDVRASFGRSEASFLIWLVTRGEEQARLREEDRLREEGFDGLLDDPRAFNALMGRRDFSSAPMGLVFYLLVRHALLEDGITDRALADYLAALLLAFGRLGGRQQVDGQLAALHHLVDIVAEGDRASGSRAFLLRAHLGEYALWLSGVFPDHINHRVQRRGAPGIRYYEELGATGFRLAARFSDAERHGLDHVYLRCADAFPALRIALNRIADRHIFPASGDRIERLLRQVEDGFNQREARQAES
jgi:hypothetical protein